MNNSHVIQDAAAIAADLPHVWLATADAEGRPHLTTAGKLSAVDGDRVTLREVFCPMTVVNARRDSPVSVVVWPGEGAQGYQLIGRVDAVTEQSIMDGYAPESETASPMPQIQRELTLRVERVLGFSHGPHSDRVEKDGR